MYVDEDDYNLFMDGDTIINMNHYQKLSQNGNSYGSGYPSGSYSFNYFNVYMGAIRQDTLLRKVYFVMPDSLNEILLYNFKLNLGDTLPSSPRFFGDLNNHITKIDSILIGTNYRKQFWLSGLNPPYQNDSNYASLIEGIGSNKGLLQPLDWPYDYKQLLCYHDDSTHWFLNDSLHDCKRFDSLIVDTATKIPSYSIFPNPAYTTITFRETKAQEDGYYTQLFVTDVLGKIVLMQSLSPADTILDISNWSKGVYFYEIRNNLESIRGKFIKAKK